MIRQTWPRCALYVLCPPLALNVLHFIYPTSNVGLQLALTVLLVLVSLLAKGAIAAFYLRERGSYSDDGAATSPLRLSRQEVFRSRRPSITGDYGSRCAVRRDQTLDRLPSTARRWYFANRPLYRFPNRIVSPKEDSYATTKSLVT